MGGLLDKANAAKETETEAKAAEPEPVVAKSAPEPVAQKAGCYHFTIRRTRQSDPNQPRRLGHHPSRRHSVIAGWSMGLYCR